MKTKISILFLCLCLGAFSQVPDNETFSFLNVTAQINGGGAVARVDLVTKSGDPNNCIVSCNGYSRTMTWNSNANLTVLDFIEDYGNSFGAVSLSYYSYGSFVFTANTAGVDFTAAAITGTGNTAVNLVPNYTGASVNDFNSCFSLANTAKFDRRYYPRYTLDGPLFNASNSLVNWRNYGAALREPLFFFCRTQDVSSLYWVWVDNSWDETGFRIERSPDGVSNWQLIHTTGANVTSYNDNGLTPNTYYYYRIRSYNNSGNSGWVTGYSQTLSFDDTDWHLPSWEELLQMYINLKAQGLGSFANDAYWSSTETQVGTTTAHGVSFTSGVPSTYGKDATARVRAARCFTAGYGAYSIGSNGPSGLIFYIESLTDGSYRYYECKTTDQSTGCSWSNITNTRCGGTYSVIPAGLNNTLRIINQSGHTNSAAKICNDLN